MKWKGGWELLYFFLSMHTFRCAKKTECTENLRKKKNCILENYGEQRLGITSRFCAQYQLCYSALIIFSCSWVLTGSLVSFMRMYFHALGSKMF